MMRSNAGTKPLSEADMTNVVQLPVVTTLNIDADMTLNSLQGKLEGFILAGYDKDGDEFFISTYADGGDALWLLERCKMALINQE